MTWNGPKWGREVLLPANPNLANILGRTDLDFVNLHVLHVLDSKFLDFQISQIWPLAGLGPGQAGLGPGDPSGVFCLLWRLARLSERRK